MQKSKILFLFFCLAAFLCFAIAASAAIYYTTDGGEAIVTGCNDDFSGSLTIPATLGGCPVTRIAEDAFYGHEGLTGVTIPASVCEIGDYAFAYCQNLTNITVAAANPDYSSDAQGVLYNKDRSQLLCCPAGKTSCSIPTSVQSIGVAAFFACTNLTSLTLPSSLTSIGWEAFACCWSLTDLSIPAAVSDIGEGAFRGLKRLTAAAGSLYFSSDAQGILYDKDQTRVVCCPAGKTEKSVEIPATVTTIGAYAFADYYDLTDIVLPFMVMHIEDAAFWGCDNLARVTIYNAGCEIAASAKTIPAAAEICGYAGSTAAAYAGTYGNAFTPIEKTTVVSDIFTFEIASGEATLIACAATASGAVTIPEQIGGVPVRHIGNCAFSCCEQITGISIPTSVIGIGYHAFELCYGLTGIVIPSSVTGIGKEAFYDCSALTAITVDTANPVYSSDSQGLLYNKNKTQLYVCPCGKTACTIPSTVTEIADSAF